MANHATTQVRERLRISSGITCQPRPHRCGDDRHPRLGHVNHHNREAAMPEMTLTPKSVRIADDEAKWLTTAAAKAGVTQNDLMRLALHRLRKDLGAASRIKPEAVTATAKASKYKLTPRRAAATSTPPAAKATPKGSRNGNPALANVAARSRGGRPRAA